MTDQQFFELLDELVEHAKLRRQEALLAANVERFKEWDTCVSGLESRILLQRLRGMIRDGAASPAQTEKPKAASKKTRPPKRKKSA
jgi:hypothetical protein